MDDDAGEPEDLDIDGGGDDLSPALGDLLSRSRRLYIDQHARAWLEILLNWEQRNEYTVFHEGGGRAGTIIEQGRGLLKVLSRLTLGSHRPMTVTVFDNGSDAILDLVRPFYVLFSDLEVQSPAGRHLGRVRKRFGLWTKIYDLVDWDGALFARITSPLWRIWTFPVRDVDGTTVAEISKKWAGLAKEYFTDADKFRVDFGDTPWSLTQRAVILAAAVSIDLDYFENNQG